MQSTCHRGKEHSIAATCRLQELRDLSIKVDLQDPIVRLIGKEDIPLRIDGRPFRKLAIIDDQLGLGTLAVTCLATKRSIEVEMRQRIE